MGLMSRLKKTSASNRLGVAKMDTTIVSRHRGVLWTYDMGYFKKDESHKITAIQFGKF